MSNYRYLDLLQLYKHPFTLIRLGRNCDGGYVVPKQLINNNLLSCGIDKEISFEEDYLKHIQNDKPNIHCFDGTIDDFPSNDLYFNWHKINIGENDTDTSVSLNTIFDKCFKNQNEVNVKMDIESFEYESFKSIYQKNLQKISFLMVEVHWICYYQDKFYELMDRLKTELVPIHLHVNTVGDYFYFNDEPEHKYGNIIEITFVNKKYIPELIPSDVKLPIKGLDFDN